MSGGWKPRNTILVEDALIALAEALQPDAGVSAYLSLPFPSGVPLGTYDPLREALSWWDPFERPRTTRDDIPWVALEEARSCLLQVLGDGDLVLSELTGRGDLVEIPRVAWRAWNADTHLRFRRLVMPGARNPLTLKEDEFRRWLVLGYGKRRPPDPAQLTRLRENPAFPPRASNKKKTGKDPTVRNKTRDSILGDLRAGRHTEETLEGKQTYLAAMYGVSRQTFGQAKQEALLEFKANPIETNSGK